MKEENIIDEINEEKEVNVEKMMEEIEERGKKDGLRVEGFLKNRGKDKEECWSDIEIENIEKGIKKII